jgi:transposase
MKKIEELNEEDKKTLKDIFKNYPTFTERNHAFGILLSYRGYSPKEIADIFSISERMVYYWIDEFIKNGIKSVYRKEGQGRKPILKKN